MGRSTNAPASRQRRKKILKAAKGYRGRRKSIISVAKDAVLRANAYAYRHRRLRKRDFRSLWITRISAAAKKEGLSYSRFIYGLKQQGIDIDRKMLSDLAISDAPNFSKLAALIRSN